MIMDKIYEKKLNKSLPSIITGTIIKNDDDKNNELIFNNNNNNKNGVCFNKGITTNCCSLPPAATSVVEIKDDLLEKANTEDIQKIENDNSFSKLKSQSTEFLNSDKNLKLNDIRQLSNDSIADQQSTNNSTDNLSYLSDCKCVAEDIFLSDDELSKSSDDCVYAYRGGGAGDYDLLDGKNVYGENVSNNLMDNVNNHHHNRNLNDDETDFLEMDFEPDPLSELEQSIEFHCKNDSGNNVSLSSIVIDGTEGRRCNELQNCSKNNEDSIFLVVMANRYPSQALNATNEQKKSNGCHNGGDGGSDDHIKNSSESDPIKKSDENNVQLSSSSDIDFKSTGAKRKKCLNKISKLPQQQTQQLSFKPSMDLNRSNTEIVSKTRTYPNYQINESDSKSNDDCYRNDMIMTCLDCIEKDFLSKTFGKNSNSTINKCSKCSIGNNTAAANTLMNQIRSSSRLSNFNNLSNKNDDEKFLYQACYGKDENLLMETLKSNEKRHQKHQKLESQKVEQIMPKDICCGLNSSQKTKFLNLNVTEKTIVQALEQLDVTYNKDIIQEHFNAIQDVRTLDIPELIVHMSKKNCDYKKIIRLIRMACKENLHIEFVPNSNIITTPSSLEIVEVSACDILRHWNRKNDLDKLKKLNKRFSEMNVLGKIVSLLRQVQQRNIKNIKPLGEYIEIPNYYKTGYICITKIS